jgi:hypothetical protein
LLFGIASMGALEQVDLVWASCRTTRNSSPRAPDPRSDGEKQEAEVRAQAVELDDGLASAAGLRRLAA